MDTGEGMCYGECCEMHKPDDSQTYTLGQIIHYMLMKKKKKIIVFLISLRVLEPFPRT